MCANLKMTISRSMSTYPSDSKNLCAWLTTIWRRPRLLMNRGVSICWTVSSSSQHSAKVIHPKLICQKPVHFLSFQTSNKDETSHIIQAISMIVQRGNQACIYLLRICTIPRHNHKWDYFSQFSDKYFFIITKSHDR